jgi:hypothetical protein
MSCGCSTPNDKKSGAMNCGNNGGSAKNVIVVPASDTKPGGYDGNNGY